MSTNLQRDVDAERDRYFQTGIGGTSEKLASISRFMSRQYLAKLICYYELFNMTRGVLGSILECGVYFGNGLMTYANLSAALEPYNYQCKIIGFDTFSGDVGCSAKDSKNALFTRKDGDYFADSYADLERAIGIFDRDRPVGHLKKVELIKGDLRQTAGAFVAEHPSLTVRILHLSVNIYEPTKAALDHFLPRMPRGSVVAIHGVNYTADGATTALLEAAGGKISDLQVRTFDFYPNMTYFIVS